MHSSKSKADWFRQSSIILIYARISPSTQPSRPPKSDFFQFTDAVVQGIFRITSSSSTTNHFDRVLIKRNFLGTNSWRAGNVFWVEQMDSRIRSWWTMRINKHVIFQIHESQDPSVNTIKEVVSAFVVKINSHSILSKMLDVIGALLNRHEHL